MLAAPAHRTDRVAMQPPLNSTGIRPKEQSSANDWLSHPSETYHLRGLAQVAGTDSGNTSKLLKLLVSRGRIILGLDCRGQEDRLEGAARRAKRLVDRRFARLCEVTDLVVGQVEASRAQASEWQPQSGNGNGNGAAPSSQALQLMEIEWRREREVNGVFSLRQSHGARSVALLSGNGQHTFRLALLDGGQRRLAAQSLSRVDASLGSAAQTLGS